MMISISYSCRARDGSELVPKPCRAALTEDVSFFIKPAGTSRSSPSLKAAAQNTAPVALLRRTRKGSKVPGKPSALQFSSGEIPFVMSRKHSYRHAVQRAPVEGKHSRNKTKKNRWAPVFPMQQINLLIKIESIGHRSSPLHGESVESSFIMRVIIDGGRMKAKWW